MKMVVASWWRTEGIVALGFHGQLPSATAVRVLPPSTKRELSCPNRTQEKKKMVGVLKGSVHLPLTHYLYNSFSTSLVCVFDRWLPGRWGGGRPGAGSLMGELREVQRGQSRCAPISLSIHLLMHRLIKYTSIWRGDILGKR